MTSPPPPRRTWALPLGRPFGVPLRLAPSFLALGLLVADLDAAVVHQRLPLRTAGVADATAVAVAAALLLSVILHELAHAAVGRALGMPVDGITLHLFGGVTSLGEEPRRPVVQFLVTLAGPLVNVLAGGIAAAVWLTSGPATVPSVTGEQIAIVNTGLALYNLLPGLPLDGGQLVRAALWQITGNAERGLRGAAYGGVAVALATFALGAREIISGTTVGVFTVAVGVLVGMNAVQALRASGAAGRISGLAAGQLARPAYEADPVLPLAEALRRAEAAGRGAVLVATRPGHPTAVVTEALLAAVPPARRPWVPVSVAAAPLNPATVLDTRVKGPALLAALRASPASDYLVVDGAQVVGVLRVDDLTHRARR